MLTATNDSERLGVALGLNVITMFISAYAMLCKVSDPLGEMDQKFSALKKCEACEERFVEWEEQEKTNNENNRIIKRVLIFCYLAFIEYSVIYAKIIAHFSTQWIHRERKRDLGGEKKCYGVWHKTTSGNKGKYFSLEKWFEIYNQTL